MCGESYDAVSDHTGGLMVALAENDCFDRVCFEPILDAVGADEHRPSIRFFHH
ncbi:MAG: hypothetical protein J07HB67_02773 [halophilic archaeon J07HB67]|nr:MAG: hypothetical protein J07HB67_02773 [halophilic archaeon J07HB67]